MKFSDEKPVTEVSNATNYDQLYKLMSSLMITI